jgi:ATP-dependent exoDNAse (exonuclease V) alpha subunit
MDSESIKLTGEQQRAVDAALSGHNVCIFGRAGVGKTTVVETIRKVLTSAGKRCQIVCSSGIACDAYDGFASTVHSHYGLQTAELPCPLLLERSLSRNNVVEQIRDVDVLVWDEISMSSMRVFELVNAIHHRLSNNANAFGGMQVLLVGDFWQLKPVGSLLDPGKSIYDSELFDAVFPHKIELQTILRQQASELELRKALDKLREGNCNQETATY